ncbi:MAG: hypothetical protein R3B70_47745, partial [Polyangiaceae bacterium]
MNLDTAAEGRDGSGHTVKILIGVKGDREKPPNERVGKPDLKAHVHVIFTNNLDAAGKVRRDTPKRSLLPDGITGWTEVRPEQEYTGEIAFTEPENLAALTVELGRTGGDYCVVRVGSTPKTGDDKVGFENWRQIYYELMMIDIEGLNDLPDVTKEKLEEIGKSIFLEYALDTAHVIAEGAAPEFAVMPKSFVDPVGKSAAPPKVVCLGSGTPFNGFQRAKGKRSIAMWLCDTLWSTSANAKTHLRGQRAVVPNPTFMTTEGNYWFPRNDLPSKNIWIKWTADVTRAQAFQHATVQFADVLKSGAKGAEQRTIEIQAAAGPVGTITYTKAFFGISTDVDAAGIQEIRAVLGHANDYAALHANHNVATITITAPNESSSQVKRLANLKAKILQEAAQMANFGISLHPGIDSDGDPLEGWLGIGAIDFTRTAFCRFALDLPHANPDDPGTLAGPLSNTRCPILLDISYYPHSPIGG